MFSHNTPSAGSSSFRKMLFTPSAQLRCDTQDFRERLEGYRTIIENRHGDNRSLCNYRVNELADSRCAPRPT